MRGGSLPLRFIAAAVRGIPSQAISPLLRGGYSPPLGVSSAAAVEESFPETMLTAAVCQQKHILLHHKKACLLVSQEDMSSCVTRRHVLNQKNITVLTFAGGPIVEHSELKTYHFYTMCFRTPSIHFYTIFLILFI